MVIFRLFPAHRRRMGVSSSALFRSLVSQAICFRVARYLLGCSSPDRGGPFECNLSLSSY